MDLLLALGTQLTTRFVLPELGVINNPQQSLQNLSIDVIACNSLPINK